MPNPKPVIGYEDELHLAKKVARVAEPILQKYFRAKFEGLGNIPDEPFLGVGNHLGLYFMPETYLWISKYHNLQFKTPMKVLIHHFFHQLMTFLHAPEKGLGMLDANPNNSLKALKGGNAVTVYPGGDRENCKPFKDRHKIDFFNHHGFVKLALRAQVPIVPIVGIGGGETLFVASSGERLARLLGLKKFFSLHTWPIFWSFPCGWHVGHLPFFSLPLPAQITVSVLPPYPVDQFREDDARDPHIVEHIYRDITKLMQQEMDRLAKNRIPIIGVVGD